MFFETLIKNLQTHTIFAIFLAVVFGVMGLVVASPLGFTLSGVAVSTFVFGAVVYLVLDFYETFGED